MRKYEIMFIVKSDTTEEERKEIVSNLENAFTKNKATITLSKELGQRELAYEIKKCKSGFYYLYNIESNDDAAVKEFKRLAKIEENVIRDLVINLDK
ncbi:MAG: 30S ribosomal protein S6 [Bacilli bacterium]|nr:30S ribosomal protein S6 [Bacilli bacterium]